MSELNSNPTFYNKQVNAFFFSHQDRLRTSIIKRFNMLNSTHFNKKAKFFNGCILYLQIIKRNEHAWDDQWKFELSMIYEGEALEGNRRGGKDIYFRGNNFTAYDEYNIEFKPVIQILTPELLQSIFHIDPNYLDWNTIYNLYFMRHGEAQHNVKFLYNPYINTELTPRGKLQARDAGNKWAKWAQQHGISSIDYFCVSDLFRTQQTAAMFLFGVRNYGSITRDKNDVKNLPRLGIRFNPTEGVKFIPTKKEDKDDYEKEEEERRQEEERLRQEKEARRPEWDINEYVHRGGGGIYNQQGGGVYNVPIVNTKNIIVIILPCLHELEKGQDDGKMSSYGLGHLTSALTLGTTSGIVSRENITNCRNKTFKQKYRFYEPNTRDCSNLPGVLGIVEDNILMNWDDYNNFYKGYRDQIAVGGREHCANTHFLGEFFKIIRNPNPVKREIPLASGKIIVPPPKFDNYNKENPSISVMSDIVRGSDEPVKRETRGTGGGGPVIIPRRNSWLPNSWNWSKSRTSGGSRSNRSSKYKKTRKCKKCKKTRKNKKNRKQKK